MSLFAMVFVALGLAMDAFAVATSAGIALGRATRRQVFRIAFHFGLFQAAMPVIGWHAGSCFRRRIQAWDHWVALGLLAFIGGKAIYEAFKEEEHRRMARTDPTRGTMLIVYSVATSIDALAVGFSFALIGVSVWTPALVIGIVTAALTMVGMMVGGRLSTRFGQRLEVLGGLILIGIGLKIFISHQFFGAGDVGPLP